MKILVLQDRLRSGGTERQAVFLTKAFCAAGHPARLLTFRPGGALADSAQEVHEPALQPFDTGLDWFAPGLLTRIADLAPDLVMTMGRMANCYAQFIQRRYPDIPVVTTLRTGKSLPWLYRRSVSRSKLVIANSQQTAATAVATLGLDPLKVAVVHNSLVFVPRPRRESGASQTNLRAELLASRSTLILLCVAMFRKEKNQRELIELVNQLPRPGDWQLWLAGEGPELAACKALVAQLALEPHVKFLGFLKDPLSVYRAADIAVLSSNKESLSNFLIEAQAHGLPAIAYDAQGVRECLVAGDTGFVVPIGDQRGFLNHLIHLMTDRDARLAMAAAARLHAHDSFSSERQVRVYLDLFERLLRK